MALNRPKRAGLVAAELTPERHEALVECRRTTRLFDTQVAQRCGVEGKTLRRWLTMGLAEDAQEPYLSFTREYAEAGIEVEVEALEEIRDGQSGKGPGQGADWKATAWWLERWKPTRWGNRVPESGPRDDIDIQQLVDESERRTRTLLELFDDPPLELEKAMRQKREAILALLAPEPEKPGLPE